MYEYHIIMSMQINNDCNENLGKVDNELKLLATSKKFPEDNVVSKWMALNAFLYTVKLIS